MVHSESATTWDVIVIGGGPPGEIAAQYAIQGSDRTAVIVEHELMGGECSYWACMPSKALLRPIEVRDAARHMLGVASIVGDRGLDVPAVLARRDSFTSNHDDTSQVNWANDTGIDVVRGHGRLVGERLVEVTEPGGATRLLRARMPSYWPPGRRRRCPTCPGCATRCPGPPVTSPICTRCPGGWR